MHGGLTFSEIQTFQNSSACLLGTDPASSRLTCFVCLLGHCLSLLSLATSSTCVLLVPGGLQLRGIFPRQWCVWESLFSALCVFMFEWSFSLAGFGTSCFSSPCSPDCLSSFAHPDQVCCGPACELFDCQRHLNQIMCLSVLLWGWYYTHHSIRKNTCECIWGQVKKNPKTLLLLRMMSNQHPNTGLMTSNSRYAWTDVFAVITRLTWHLHLFKGRLHQKMDWMRSSAMLLPVEWKIDSRAARANWLCISHSQQHIRCDMAVVILWELLRLLHFIS